MYFCCRLEAGDRLCYLSDQWVFSFVSLYSIILYYNPYIGGGGQLCGRRFFRCWCGLRCLFACPLPAASVLAFFGLVGRAPHSGGWPLGGKGA